ncbi:zf-HC2 domain-containing protein [Streptomyces sp. NPDC058773]|uniref:zf-HC2 domain-containing protein n=1 Tax=Streptomyces sp. NPDC058773 TaxID=3346632 RepID=UPI0036A1C707
MSAVEDPHEAVGAYVLHALPPEEAAAFSRHLAGCDACTREVAELEATVVCLADAEAVRPPEALRRRVLEEIAATAQEQLLRREPSRRREPRRGPRTDPGQDPPADPRTDPSPERRLDLEV